MRVERGGAIHGIPTAALKAMLTRRHGRLTTPQAMADLGLAEPAATRSMLALAADGYLEFAGRPNAVDVWETGERGRRLIATKIVKRFPAREGRRIVEAVVAAAREANADASASVRVTWIALFGSLLDADDDALVGDVDLIVRIGRRRLPKAEGVRTKEAEPASTSSSDDGGDPFRTTVELLRRLARVSPKVTLMTASTLSLGIRHRPVYAFDERKGAEVPVSGRTRTSKAAPEEARRVHEDGLPPPPFEPRPWPARPGPRPTSDVCDRDRLARGDRLTAQHMWQRGLNIEEISARLHLPEWLLATYLAAQATRPEGPLVDRASLSATLATNLPEGTAVVREATAMMGKGRYSGVRLTLTDGLATCGATMTTADDLIVGDMSLAPLVERACAAAERWRLVASKALRRTEATCQVGLTTRECASADGGVPDLMALRSACGAWLRAAGPVQASFGAHGRSLRVEVGGPEGAKVDSHWTDRDPATDDAVVAEAERSHHEVASTGATWTFWFSDDFTKGP